MKMSKKKLLEKFQFFSKIKGNGKNYFCLFKIVQ